MQNLKDLYSSAFIKSLSGDITKAQRGFNEQDFTRAIFCKEWDDLSLKERMAHIRKILFKHLNTDLSEAIDILVSCLKPGLELEYLFVPDYIQAYGIEEFSLAMHGFEQSTAYCSAEFGMRPFIEKYPTDSFKQLHIWSQSANEHLRRLASECCRPLLPWGEQLKALRKDPTPILPLLNHLCDDPSEYVRRSVANNLNDISKDHPALALSIAKEWCERSKISKKTAKHGMRTLLKKGDQKALALFGLQANASLSQQDLILNGQSLEIGESLNFSFAIINKSKEDILCRIEYRVYYVRKAKAYGSKIFKISQKPIPPGKLVINRKQHFKNLSTRKHYPGEHFIEIILNGKTFEKKSFYLQQEKP